MPDGAVAIRVDEAAPTGAPSRNPLRPFLACVPLIAKMAASTVGLSLPPLLALKYGHAWMADAWEGHPYRVASLVCGYLTYIFLGTLSTLPLAYRSFFLKRWAHGAMMESFILFLLSSTVVIVVARLWTSSTVPQLFAVCWCLIIGIGSIGSATVFWTPSVSFGANILTLAGKSFLFGLGIMINATIFTTWLALSNARNLLYEAAPTLSAESFLTIVLLGVGYPTLRVVLLAATRRSMGWNTTAPRDRDEERAATRTAAVFLFSSHLAWGMVGHLLTLRIASTGFCLASIVASVAMGLGERLWVSGRGRVEPERPRETKLIGRIAEIVQTKEEAVDESVEVLAPGEVAVPVREGLAPKSAHGEDGSVASLSTISADGVNASELVSMRSPFTSGLSRTGTRLSKNRSVNMKPNSVVADLAIAEVASDSAIMGALAPAKPTRQATVKTLLPTRQTTTRTVTLSAQSLGPDSRVGSRQSSVMPETVSEATPRSDSIKEEVPPEEPTAPFVPLSPATRHGHARLAFMLADWSALLLAALVLLLFTALWPGNLYSPHFGSPSAASLLLRVLAAGAVKAVADTLACRFETRKIVFRYEDCVREVVDAGGLGMRGWFYALTCTLSCVGCFIMADAGILDSLANPYYREGRRPAW